MTIHRAKGLLDGNESGWFLLGRCAEVKGNFFLLSTGRNLEPVVAIGQLTDVELLTTGVSPAAFP